MPNYNYFPVGYPQMVYPQQSYSQPQPQQMQPSSSIVWVQGEAGAKAYPIAPSTTMLLMDSEGEQFYIKSTDASGMPQPLRTFHYKEVVSQPEQSYNQPAQISFNPNEYTRREDFERLERRIDELGNAMQERGGMMKDE